MKNTAILFAAISTSVGFARAQTLPQHETVVQQIYVRILTEGVDRSVVSVGAPLHLKIHAGFAQNITQLDNLNLPALEDFDQVSSERHFTPSTGGSSFDATITLVPKHAGTIEIGPVSIDGINSRTQFASKFSSTDHVVVHVLPAIPAVGHIERSDLVQYASIAAIALSVAALSYQIGNMFLNWLRDGMRGKREHASPGTHVQRAATALGPGKTPVLRLREAVETIRRDPSQAHAEEVRSALRDALDAGDEETLTDIIERMPQNERGVLDRALRAAERAAFIETTFRRSAIEDGLPIFEAALRRLESQSSPS